MYFPYFCKPLYHHLYIIHLILLNYLSFYLTLFILKADFIITESTQNQQDYNINVNLEITSKTCAFHWFCIDNVKYGNLSFDGDADKNDDSLGADTNGNYSKVNLNLLNTIAFTNELSLDTSLLLQYALGNKNLDGSKDISIGGLNGVKLYPDGEVSAENGYVYNAESKYKLPQ